MLPPTINYTVAVTTIFDHQISHIFSLSQTSKKNHSIPPPLQKNNLESPKKQDKEIIPKNTKITCKYFLGFKNVHKDFMLAFTC